MSSKVSPAESMLKKLRKLEANMVCPNCGTIAQVGVGFGNVCVKFRTFICDMCKTSHQAISHRVKSISMSNWTMDEVNELMDCNLGGNRAAAHIWLQNAPPFGSRYAGGVRPKAGDRVEVFKQFVLDAYEHGKFKATTPYVPSNDVAIAAQTRATHSPTSALSLAQPSVSRTTTSSTVATPPPSLLDDYFFSAPSQSTVDDPFALSGQTIDPFAAPAAPLPHTQPQRAPLSQPYAPHASSFASSAAAAPAVDLFAGMAFTPTHTAPVHTQHPPQHHFAPSQPTQPSAFPTQPTQTAAHQTQTQAAAVDPFGDTLLTPTPSAQPAQHVFGFTQPAQPTQPTQPINPFAHTQPAMYGNSAANSNAAILSLYASGGGGVAGAHNTFTHARAASAISHMDVLTHTSHTTSLYNATAMRPAMSSAAYPARPAMAMYSSSSYTHTQHTHIQQPNNNNNNSSFDFVRENMQVHLSAARSPPPNPFR